MELFRRLFGATRDAIEHPHFEAGSRAVGVSATILRECIDLGFAGTDGPNRGRLTTPFSRGYIFGFSDACIQRFGVLDELQLLALITEVHTKLFSDKIGSLLVANALRDQHNAALRCGQIAGAEDLLRWLNDRSCTPLLLVRFLQADDATSCPMAPTGESLAESGIEPTHVLARCSPSSWNNAVVRRRALEKMAPDERATIIPVRPGSHRKTIKPTKH